MLTVVNIDRLHPSGRSESLLELKQNQVHREPNRDPTVFLTIQWVNVFV